MDKTLICRLVVLACLAAGGCVTPSSSNKSRSTGPSTKSSAPAEQSTSSPGASPSATVAKRTPGPNLLYKIGDSHPSGSNKSRSWWIEQSKKGSGLNAGFAALTTNQPSRAEAVARNYLLENPGSSAAFELLAYSYLAQRNTYKAKYYASQALKINKNRSGPYNILGLVEALDADSAADYEKSKSLLERAHSLSRGGVAAGINLANIRLETGEISESKVTFAAMVKRCDECFPALLGLGIALRRAGDVNQSLLFLRKAVSKDGVDSVAKYHLALTYKKIRKYKEAISILNNLLDSARPSPLIENKAKALRYQVRILYNEEIEKRKSQQKSET